MVHTLDKGASAPTSIVEALADILERAELECDWARRAGEQQGNYRHIALAAKRALRDLGVKR